MGEKEFNTNEVEEEMSLSGQLSRRRRQRRMTEESNSSAVGADEKNADSTGDASEMEGVSDQDHGTDRTEHVKAETQEDKKIRITMLGISGSGKTSFLSGVYQTMIMDSFHGLSLVPSIDSGNSYQQIGQIADIALINRKDFDFADGTLETTIFPLTLQNRGKEICRFDFTDYAEGIPAFICIAAMPFFYSISEGISMGVISYVVLNLVSGKAKEKKISPVMYVLAVMFLLKYVLI